MMNIKNIKIKGFRGFVNEQEIDLSSPVVILFGENAKGKSSTPNAIEWCLFGQEVIGKNTGIRERIDWEVKNRQSKECYVEIEFEKDGSSYTLMREWISPKKDKIKLSLSNGRSFEGEEAESELKKLINNYSFKDFMTTVFQHQEAIRFVLTQEPKERNEALDRLFGLSDYRNILDGIKNTEIKPQELEDKIDSFSREIKGRIGVFNQQISEKESELVTEGISKDRINNEGADDLVKNIKVLFEIFSQKVSLPLSSEFISADPKDYKGLLEKAKKEITRFRSEMPDIQEQKKKWDEKQKMEKLMDDYKRKKNDLDEKNKLLKQLIEKLGDRNKLKKEKEEKEQAMKELEAKKEGISLLGATIEKAIKYLKTEQVVDKNVCPVCGTKKENLLQHLEEEYEKNYKALLEEINGKIDSIKKELKEADENISKLAKLENEKNQAEEEYKKVEQQIRASFEISERDVVERVLEKRIQQVNNELKEIEQILNKKQEELNKIEKEASKLEKVYEILRLKEQREKAREIEKTPEWNSLKSKSEEFKKLWERIEKIKGAIQKYSQKEAKDIIDLASKKINEYFKKITKHPMIEELKLEVNEDSKTGGNNYEFIDKKGEKIPPILSQGNYNALALSIFLSMADLKGQMSVFDMLIFDDPSQSLGSSEKEEFVKILETFAKKRKIILSTMDGELFQQMKNYLPQKKTVYVFTKWEPHSGPEIKKEEE